MIIYGKDEPVIQTGGIHFRDGQDSNIKLPKVAIGVFSRLLLNEIIEKYPCLEVGYMRNANYDKNVYILKYKDTEITLFMAGVGASHIAADIEELSYHGVKTFIIFGNCGVLDKTIPDCGIIIPTKAYGEDGTSYHYVDYDGEITLCSKYKDDFKKILQEYNFDYREGYTWTTDAFYRETRDKVAHFKDMGCVCVEMEAASIAAVCKHKNLDYFTFYYAGDNLDSVVWEERSLHSHSELDKKKKVALLALDLAKSITKKNI